MNIVIAQPEPEHAAYMESLLQTYGEESNIVLCHDLDSALQTCLDSEEGSVLFTELYWDNADASDVILLHCLDNPRTCAGIISQYDLSHSLPPDYPIPRVSGFEDTDCIAELYVTLREDLRQQQLGPFQIHSFAGQGFLGRMYHAHQASLKREVSLTLSPINAYPEEIERFQATSAARAGNLHPSVYAIYEELKVQNRYIIAAEPPSGPSLFQFASYGATFDDRLVAKIIFIAADVLNHLHNQAVPHTPLRAYDITLSENGVVKVHNTALPPNESIPNAPSEIRALYEIVSPFLNASGSVHPQLAHLLGNMKTGMADLQAVLQISRQVDLELAPVVNVPERTSQTRASEEIRKARKSNVIWVIGGSILSAVSLAFIVILTLDRFVVVEPMKDFRDQVAVPAGSVQINKDTTVQVDAFYMDTYEVTIGQYKRFLEAIEGTDAAQWLPPNYPYPSKTNFRPAHWDDIVQTIESKKRFLGEEIHWDMPVFNVDYADAYAYAKWAGKRLPTQAEWIRAASGNDNFKLPWGNEVEVSFANTGWDLEANSQVEKAGGVDGYKGPNPVNALKKDVSPFGVIGMAGNVSEWVVPIEENPPAEEDKGLVHGGSYFMRRPVANTLPQEIDLGSNQSWVGIRCVSDQPVQ